MIVSSTKWTILCLFLFITGSVLADANYNSQLNKQPVVCSANETRHHFSLNNFQQTVQLQDLKPGVAYRLVVLSGDGDASCALEVRTVNGQLLTKESTGVWQWTPTMSKQDFVIISNQCTANHLITLSLGQVNPPARMNAMQGISVDTDLYTVEELIEEVFIGGDCFQVEPGSIQFSGGAASIGYFTTGETAIDIEEGIILSTGEAADAIGPNSRYNTGSWVDGTAGDADLLQLMDDNYPLRDRVALEFDFTPTSEMISFEFVFASEEYCEYVNSDFNDVFGFFISGPGINGPFTNNAENIAFIPGSNDYISINSINHLQNQEYYNNNVPLTQHDDMPGALSCPSLEDLQGLSINTLEYDGFTDVMTAMATVIPCETYHIKLVISDVQDAYFDSAVFLKANSFSAGGTALVSSEVPGFDDGIVTEDCVEGYFRFTRTNDEIDEPVIINFDVLPTSTATPGVDYETLPDSIIIPAGEMYYDLVVQAIPDQLIEGTENIILEMDVPCSCSIPFSEILITDNAPLEVAPSDETVCNGEPVIITPDISGGIGTLTYLWSNGDTLPETEVTPTSNEVLTLTVTDQCGKSVTTNHDVFVTELPEATLSGAAILCNTITDSAVPVTLEGGGPWTIEYTIDGVLQNPITDILDDNYDLSVNEIGTYEIITVANGSCEGIASGTAEVTEVILDATLVSEPLTCPDAANGSISATALGGTAPYSYQWSNNVFESEITALDSGQYQLTITDQNGCQQYIESTVILDPDVPELSIDAADILTCETTAINLSATASSGSQYQYFWTTDDGQIIGGNTSLTPEVTEPGHYELAVTNTTTGCVQTDTILVSQNIAEPEPVVFVQGAQTLTCDATSTILDATASQPFGNVEFEWTTTDGYVDPANVNLPLPEIDSAGLYQLVVTDMENGCTATNSVYIDLNVEVPEVIFASPDILNCNNLTIDIDATASSSGNMMNYIWTDENGQDLNENTPTLTTENPGDYFLEILNTENGCAGQSVVTVVQDTVSPVAMITPVTEMLDCNTFTLSIVAENSSQGNIFNYNWNTNDGNILTGNTSLVPEIDAPGTYQLVVSNTENGCVSSAAVQVMEDVTPPDVLLELDGSEVLNCYDTSTYIYASSSIPAGQLLYQWSVENGAVIYDNPAGDHQTVFDQGTYQVMVTNQENGCTNSDQIEIFADQEIPHAEILTPDWLTCIQDSVLLDGSGSAVDNFIFYEWTTSSGVEVPNAVTASIFANQVEEYTLHVVNSRNGCIGTASTPVFENTILPLAEIIPAEEMLDCNTPELSISALHTDSVNYQFEWNTLDGNILSNLTANEITVNQDGLYELVVTDTQNGCSATTTTPVVEDTNRPNELILDAITPPCYGDPGQLNILSVSGGEGPYLYAVLEESENFYPDTVYQSLMPGNYTVQVQDLNGCIYEETILISEPPALQVNVQPEFTITLGETQELLATVNVPDSQIDSIYWSPVINTDCQNCFEVEVRPFEDTPYTVTTIDQNGCKAEASTLVLVDNERRVYIPNAFSPNDDGNNDEWRIYTNEISIAKVNTLQIFNRWGEKVFENNNFFPDRNGEGWNGQFKNQKAMDGVYVYFVEIEFVDGVVEQYEGDVTLLR